MKKDVYEMFDVCYINMGNDVIGSEQGGERPAVILQNNIGNQYSTTLIVAPITAEIKKNNMPTHCLINPTKKNGLARKSVVLCEQIRVIDKKRVISYIGKIDNRKDARAIVKAYIANILGGSCKKVKTAVDIISCLATETSKMEIATN